MQESEEGEEDGDGDTDTESEDDAETESEDDVETDVESEVDSECVVDGVWSNAPSEEGAAVEVAVVVIVVSTVGTLSDKAAVDGVRTRIRLPSETYTTPVEPIAIE